jgi:hypothetical protein
MFGHSTIKDWCIKKMLKKVEVRIEADQGLI